MNLKRWFVTRCSQEEVLSRHSGLHREAPGLVTRQTNGYTHLHHNISIILNVPLCIKHGFLFWCFHIGELTDHGETAHPMGSQILEIVNDLPVSMTCVCANWPIQRPPHAHPLYLALMLQPIFPCPYHLRVKCYHTTWDSPSVPEPAEIIQSSLS